MPTATRAPAGAALHATVAARGAGRGVALVVVGAFLWSTSGLFVDRLITGYHITPLTLSWWRVAMVSGALAVFLALHEPGSFRLSRREASFYIAYGLVGIAVFNVVFSASVQINKAAVGIALVFSAPAFVALADWLLLHKRLAPAQIGAVAINLLGCILVAGVYSPTALIARPAGLGLGLASGLAFAAYTLFGKGATRVGPRSSLSIMFYIFFFAAICLLLWGVPAEGAHLFRPALDAWGWCLMIGLTMGPTLGGYLCFTSCLRYLSATVASLFTTLELPVAALLAFVILGRALSVLQWLGASLIVIGVLIAQISSVYQSR